MALVFKVLLFGLAGLASLALALLLAGALYQLIGTWRDARRFPPPGQRLRASRHRLHIHSTGEGAPAVVMDAGLPGTGLSWLFVQPEVARFTRALSYDRAGLGWSDAGPEPRTSRRIVEELRALLRAAGVPPPFVLVGHSFGGFTAQLYAATYPEEVAGLVLVDSIHPGEWLNRSSQGQLNFRRLVRSARRTAWLARFGVVRFYLFLVSRRWVRPQGGGGMFDALKKLPPELLPVVGSFWSRPKTFNALASQLAHLQESAAQVAAAPLTGDKPLWILSAGDTSGIRRWEQEATARSSSRGRHQVVPNSGHWIQLEQPEPVVAAIRAVVTAARESSRPN